jgi:hypothetical protein
VHAIGFTDAGGMVHTFQSSEAFHPWVRKIVPAYFGGFGSTVASVY